MQSEIVLQPRTLGIDHASHESETTCIAICKIKEGNLNMVNYTNPRPKAIIIDELIDFPGNLKPQIGVYESAEDQQLYRALRQQGCNPEEAHTAILLSGSEGHRKLAFSPSAPQKASMWEFKENKKELPFYFARRRF
jgi:hypothetical protein